MNIFVVYAHHEPTSLTSALKNTTVSTLQQAGHTVAESDLYAQGFQPMADKIDFMTMSGNHFNYMLEQRNSVVKGWTLSPDIVTEFQKLSTAELVIFHFPVWWFSVPAILKGWFDRVLVMGGAWDGHGQIYDRGLLRGKRALVVACAGGPEEYYQKEGKHKATMNEILHPVLHGTLAFCGMDILEPYVVYGVNSSKDEETAVAVENFQQFIGTVPTSPNFYYRFDDLPVAPPPEA